MLLGWVPHQQFHVTMSATAIPVVQGANQNMHSLGQMTGMLGISRAVDGHPVKSP